MKKCPFCAEEIQDAAIKCRFCGSMLNEPPHDPAAPPPVPTLTDAPAPPGEMSTSSWIAVGVVLALVAGVVLLLAIQRSQSQQDLPAATTSPTSAATLAPATVTSGEYRFLGLPWNASRNEVHDSLTARGFSTLGRDEDGDDRYQGRVDGRDAGVAAMFAGDKLAKVMVVLLSPDPGGVYELTRQSVQGAYGAPARQQGAATVWPERSGSLVWVTMDAERHVKVNFESPQWPAESRRRKGAK